MIKLKHIAPLVLALAILTPPTANSQTANLEFRIEGADVYILDQPILGRTQVKPGTQFNMIWSAETSIKVKAATIGFIIYSPDASITEINWLAFPRNVGEWGDVASWPLGGPQLVWGPDQFDGTLPSTFLTGGTGVDGPNFGFGPTPLQDITVATISASEGILCIDSARFPPAGDWLFVPGPFPGYPSWGATIGGYSDGGFCIDIKVCDTCVTMADTCGAACDTVVVVDSTIVEFRVEGHAVFNRDTPDSVFARVKPGTPFNMIWSIETSGEIGQAQLHFVIYSPDNSITTHMWNQVPTPVGEWLAWGANQTVVTPNGESFDGILPRTFFTGGNSWGPSNGFTPTPLVDIVVGVSTISQEGIICIDSILSPNSAGGWLINFDTESGLVETSGVWGRGLGGYPVGGFCIEIKDCDECNVPGDANNDGSANIADVVYGTNLIFRGGKAIPCPREGDANGSGSFNIADVVYMVNLIFRGGPAPVCGP